MPRYKIYGRVLDHFTVLWDALAGRLAKGDDSAALERRFQALTGHPFALAMPQARVAIYTAIRAIIAVSGKRRIVMSPYTIFDVVNMVVAAGGIPVFADIQRETCNIDPDDAERCIDDDCAAIMITHLHGLACDVLRFQEMARSRGIYLVEDAAQAMGVRVNGQMVGGFGDAGAFSFGLAKNVNAFFGGMLTLRSPELAEPAKRIAAEMTYPPAKRLVQRMIFGAVTAAVFSNLPFRLAFFRLFRFGYLHDIEALNKRVRVEDNPQIKTAIPPDYQMPLTATQARIVLRQLADVDAAAQCRIATARIYHEGLRDISDIILPPWREDGSHTYMAFAIQVPDRHALLRHLFNSGRDCALHHYKNCADLDCFTAYGRDCPNTRIAAQQSLFLPTYPGYNPNEAKATLNAVRSFFGKASKP